MKIVFKKLPSSNPRRCGVVKRVEHGAAFRFGVTLCVRAWNGESRLTVRVGVGPSGKATRRETTVARRSPYRQAAIEGLKISP